MVGDPEICPGYLVALPEVLDAFRAHLHWSKGQLRERLDGLDSTGILMDCIEVAEGASRLLERYVLDAGKG